MKYAASILALICTTSVFAQEADELSLSLHANTASPLMLGANYQLADRIHIRTSPGYSQYTQEFSRETSDDDRTVRCTAVP